jgi:hypothetical protein
MRPVPATDSPESSAVHIITPSLPDICAISTEKIECPEASERRRLQAERDQLFRTDHMVHESFEEIQAQQLRILLQAWYGGNGFRTLPKEDSALRKSLRAVNRKLKKRGIQLKDIAGIHHQVLGEIGYSPMYSRAGKVAYYLLIPFDYSVYDSRTMTVMRAMLLDLMDVSSLEEILKYDRLGRKLIFGEMECLMTEDYEIAKGIENYRAKEPPREGDELEYELKEEPWLQIFERTQNQIVENTKLLRELDDREARGGVIVV